MSIIIPTHRQELIEKLTRTYKPFATRVSAIMQIEGVTDKQVESTMVDCIIELEKIQEAQIINLIALESENIALLNRIKPLPKEQND